MPGYSSKNKFIATQGPKQETVKDFWRMVDEYNVKVIIMLTNLIENNVEKCTQYWPDSVGSSVFYDNYELIFLDEKKYYDYIKRSFRLLNKINNESKEVFQYYYPKWTDRETPQTDLISIFSLINDVNLNHGTWDYPFIVHCSAGIGRTGTYITLDGMKERLDKENRVNIAQFVGMIRDNREKLVQTLKQYVYIYDALNEYSVFGMGGLKIESFLEVYQRSKLVKEKRRKNGRKKKVEKNEIELEFEKLQEDTNFLVSLCYLYTKLNLNEIKKSNIAMLGVNLAKNRNLIQVPYDFNRVFSNKSSEFYINATNVLLPNSKYANKFIIAQNPIQNTMNDFVKMIFEQECGIVISITKYMVSIFPKIFY